MFIRMSSLIYKLIYIVPFESLSLSYLIEFFKNHLINKFVIKEMILCVPDQIGCVLS